MIKYSRQRESIVNFLASRTDHPTAETIYQNIKKEFPNISLGTVYRNLSLLEEIGEIIKISTGVGPDHYDYNTAPHYHFICRGCGRVMDIDLDFADELMTQVQESTDLAIESCSVSFTGLCPDCKKEHLLTEEEKAFMGIPAFKPVKVYEPCGCERCDHTGYKGRIGIYEIMTVTPKLKTLIGKGASPDEINETACAEGMHTLRQSAIRLVLQGVTSYHEMLKTTFEN